MRQEHRKKLVFSVISTLIFQHVLPAFAADTATDTFQVTATVNDACTITANDLAFGTYDPLSGSTKDGTTTLGVTCTSDTAYQIGLSAGSGGGATVASRIMSDGSSNDLTYSLYQEISHSTVWGETLSSDTISSTGTGSAQNFTIYGQIVASQNVPPGAYSDTVTATVTY